MTLCIAALCREGFLGPQRVVLAFDWRVETATASAETEYKFSYLGEHWGALLAGPVVEARELVSVYESFFRANGSGLRLLGLTEKLREPLWQFRKSLADRYTHALYTKTYDEFLEASFPESVVTEHVQNVSRQSITAELILIGLVDGQFVIAHVANGDVMLTSAFAAIGSGYAIAESTLFQRKQHDLASLQNTIYCVYEAKKLGEIAPGVGKTTTMMILRRDEKSHTLVHDDVLDSDLKYLDAQFKKFGPRPLRSIKLPPNYAAWEKERGITQSAPLGLGLTIDDPLPLPPSPELPGGTDES